MEFGEELELKRAAYPYSIQSDCEGYNELVTVLLAQLTEELLLLRGAEDAGIVISTSDVETEANRLKSEYPDNQFERMLIENAVTYAFWVRRLQIDMTIDALLEKKINETIEITAGDISRYYENHQKQASPESERSSETQLTEKRLVAQLRIEKAEEHYPKLIQSLAEVYPVEINHDKLQLFFKACETKQSEIERNQREQTHSS